MRRVSALFLLAAIASCGSDPADVAGNYSTAVTNRENGCNFDNYTEGESSSNIPVVITQEGEDATATVGGVAGGVLDFWLGSRAFAGTVDGNNVDLTLFGENSFNDGNCSFTFNAELTAEVDGDVITGNIRYRAATNNNPDCSAIEGCVTRQEFNGTRPPQ
jgi:hypothetical protein